MISHTLMDFSLNLDWLKLPAIEDVGFMEFILIYQSWSSVLLDGMPKETFDLLSDEVNQRQ